jgi:hypothetical protein
MLEISIAIAPMVAANDDRIGEPWNLIVRVPRA